MAIGSGTKRALKSVQESKCKEISFGNEIMLENHHSLPSETLAHK